MKNLFLIPLICSVFLSCAPDSAQQAKETPEENTEVLTDTLTPAGAISPIVGRWRSIEDAGFEVLFTEGGVYTEFHQGKEIFTAAYVLSDGCQSEQKQTQDYVSLLFPGKVHCSKFTISASGALSLDFPDYAQPSAYVRSPMEVQTVNAIIEKTPLNQAGFGGCSAGSIFGFEPTATSALPAQGKTNYNIFNAFDGDVRTAWVEGVDDYGMGEHIEIDFSNFEIMGEDADAEPATAFEITAFQVLNGFCKNETTYANNGKVAKFKLLLNNRHIYDLVLHDAYAVQLLTLPLPITVTKHDKLRFEITETHPGLKYSDTGISILAPIAYGCSQTLVAQ